MSRVVFDANVWVSGIAYPVSVPAQAIESARQGEVVSLISEPLLDQIRRALLSPRFGQSITAVREMESRIGSVSLIVVPTVRLSVITAKESDNRGLECTVAGQADLIVTGDRKHLLPLGQYQGIPIISPADFVRSLP